VEYWMNESLYTGDCIQLLVEKYSDMLIRIAYTHMKNMSDAEDVVQNVFLKYLEKTPAFESEEHKKAWLIRVCINLCKNCLKTFWFRKTVELHDDMYGFTNEEHEVMETIVRLPVKYRSIIHLFYYEDYSIAQIASITRQKESTTGSQLYRARQLLKSMLKEEIDDE
jgi:RNA polymerase sigma-70 factor (ECF subfamily)